MNSQTDMKLIRRNGGGYTDLLYQVLENDITVDEIRDAVMYAFEYGIEEVEEPKIPYIKTATRNIVISGSVHISYVDPDAERENIPINEFIDYLMHVSQSGIFAETINWRYVDLFDSGRFLIEGDISHNNGYELVVAIVSENKEDKYKIAEILRGSEE